MGKIRQTVKLIFLFLVDFFRYLTNPLGRSRCRFYPGCGDYCREAVKKHGLTQGFCLTLGRLLRCHWGVPSGVDWVPECNHKET
jgi:uncharacterized protein